MPETHLLTKTAGQTACRSGRLEERGPGRGESFLEAVAGAKAGGRRGPAMDGWWPGARRSGA